MAEGDRADQWPEPDPRRDRRERCEHLPRLEPGDVILPGDEVVRDPQRVVADRFDPQRGVLELRPGHGSRGELHPEVK